MKNKTIYILFITGVLLIITGALLKIMQYESGNFILGIGFGLKVGSVALFIGKLIRTKSKNL